MRALLAVGGESPPKDRILGLLGSIGLVCAADSGLDLLYSWGIRADIVVGDMDSISRPELLELYPPTSIHKLLVEKDESDTEAGLRLCNQQGASDIVIVGGGGGRLDHLLAIRALFERRLRPREWHFAANSLHLVEEGSTLEFATESGDLISVFPLAQGSADMHSQGLRWSLNGLEWDAGSYGLSNFAIDTNVKIGAGKGDLLVVRNWLRTTRP